MTLITAHGAAGGVLGTAAQNAWNTIAAGSATYVPRLAGGLKKVQPTIFSQQTRGWTKRHGRNGNITVDGQTPQEFYFVGLEDQFNNEFDRTSAEVASYTATVTTEDTIDFKEDGGGTLNATVAPGTYTSSGLATALKTALEAAGAGTYTITYSTSTKKFTVAVAGGASAVELLGTGDFEDVIGFTTSSGSAASVVSDTAVPAVYDHTLVLPDDGSFPNQYGLTLWDFKDLKTWRVFSAFMTALEISITQGSPFVMWSPTWLAASRTLIANPTPTFGTGVPASPIGNLTCSVTTSGGSRTAYGTEFKLAFAIPTVLRHWAGSTTAVKAARSDKASLMFNFAWDYNDDNINEEWLTDWDAGTYAALSMVLNGATLRGAIKESLTVTLPELVIAGEDPMEGGSGFIEQSFNSEAQYDFSASAAAVTMVLRNNTYQA